MWVKVDDNFTEHWKLFEAGRHLGPSGPGRVAAVWLEGICYANRNLTDGFLPRAVVAKFKLDRRPLDVAVLMALPEVRLWEETATGWRIHDYHDHNPTAAEVKAKREADRERKKGRQSTRNPPGIHPESDRIPERSRGRDPNPNPNPDPIPVRTYRTHTTDVSGFPRRTEIHPKETAAKSAARNSAGDKRR